MRIYQRNWMQVEANLRHEDRAVLPLGSTEQHAHLSLGTDAILAERVAVEAAEPLERAGVSGPSLRDQPVFPGLPGLGVPAGRRPISRSSATSSTAWHTAASGGSCW